MNGTAAADDFEGAAADAVLFGWAGFGFAMAGGGAGVALGRGVVVGGTVVVVVGGPAAGVVLGEPASAGGAADWVAPSGDALPVGMSCRSPAAPPSTAPASGEP